MIVLNHPAIAPMVAEALGEDGFGDCYAIGNVKDNELIGGCVFHWFTGPSVQMSLAGTGNWMTRAMIKACCEYAFLGLKCVRITVLIATSNENIN